MSVRMTLVFLAFLACCGVSHAQENRWLNFAEDTDLKYFLDQKSVLSLPDNVYLFWVKSVAKDKDYFKKEFNLNGLSYIFTSYELDCAVSRYRVRGSILFDKNRKELSKTLPGAEPLFEPVPPESMLELAQDEVCSRAKAAAEQPEDEEDVKSSPPARGARATASSVSTLAPPAVGEIVGKVALPGSEAGVKGEGEGENPGADRGGEELTPPPGPDSAAGLTAKGPVVAAEPAIPPVPAVPETAVPAEPAAPAEPPTMQ